jgi:hypothetical protein
MTYWVSVAWLAGTALGVQLGRAVEHERRRRELRRWIMTATEAELTSHYLSGRLAPPTETDAP